MISKAMETMAKLTTRSPARAKIMQVFVCKEISRVYELADE